MLVGLLLGAWPAQAAPPAASAFTVSVSYTPSSIDPLQITFTTTVFPGTPTAFAWRFGDGQFLNASGPTIGPGVANPVHRYAAGGTFPLVVTVWEGNDSVTSSLKVTIVPAPLSAVVHATALQPPLTYLFQVVISGGSATYRTILWSFGDGHNGSGAAIEYTYAQPGRYRATVNVTDSDGSSAVGGLLVNATGPVPANGGGFDPTEWGALVGGIAAGSAATGLIGYALLRRGRASSGESLRRGSAPAGVRSPSETSRVAPRPAPVAEIGRAARRPEASEARLGASSASLPAGARATPPSSEALRLSQRIVLHLAAQGTLGPDEVASLGFTQTGISRALSVRQNALTNVLRRLVAAEVVVTDVRHVHGQPRRLKVYRLTARGLALARDLRRPRRSSPDSPGRAPADRGG